MVLTPISLKPCEDWGIDLMDKLTLQWKFFIYLLGFCLLLLGILWTFQTVFLSDMYKFVRKLEIEKAIKLVGNYINSPDLQFILNELEMTKEITVRPTQDFAPPVIPVQWLLGDILVDQKQSLKCMNIP